MTDAGSATGAAHRALDGGKPEPGSRFEKGAVLAWLVEREGYRAGAEWAFTPVEGMPGASRGARRLVDLREALKLDPGSPEVRMEPTGEGEVRITARVGLVVHRYGDEAALAAGQAVVVPYGSVVRAGALLLAPLYAEQVESVQEGRLALPRPAGGSVAEGERLTALDAAAAPPNPRRPLLLVWAILWLLAFPGSAAFVIYFTYGYSGDAWSTGSVSARTVGYSIGGLWLIIAIVGGFIHRLVSRFVHAGRPETGG